MKKLILLAILLVPFIASASIDKNIGYGSRGVEVTELQEFLIDKGFLNGNATGNFFSLTKKAVIAYQKSVLISPTGFVGVLTRAKINEELLADISEEELQSAPVVTVSPETKALQDKIDALNTQIKNLADQQNSQSQQTNQLLGSVVQNTTPAPNLGSVPVPEVVKSLDIQYNPQYHIVKVFYKENGVAKENVPITISTDVGYLNNVSKGGATGENTNELTALSRAYGWGGEYVGIDATLNFYDKPRDLINGVWTTQNPVIPTYIKATANGIEKIFNLN